MPLHITKPAKKKIRSDLFYCVLQGSCGHVRLHHKLRQSTHPCRRWSRSWLFFIAHGHHRRGKSVSNLPSLATVPKVCSNFEDEIGRFEKKQDEIGTLLTLWPGCEIRRARHYTWARTVVDSGWAFANGGLGRAGIRAAHFLSFFANSSGSFKLVKNPSKIQIC
jgi:hypothetical protein